MEATEYDNEGGVAKKNSECRITGGASYFDFGKRGSGKRTRKTGHRATDGKLGTESIKGRGITFLGTCSLRPERAVRILVKVVCEIHYLFSDILWNPLAKNDLIHDQSDIVKKRTNKIKGKVPLERVCGRWIYMYVL